MITKGTWEVGPGGDTVRDDKSRLIADCANYYNNKSKQEQKANAHAISAVKELLAACKKFKEMYIQDTDLNKQTDFYVEVCAAIAKAEPSS